MTQPPNEPVVSSETLRDLITYATDMAAWTATEIGEAEERGLRPHAQQKANAEGRRFVALALSELGDSTGVLPIEE